MGIEQDLNQLWEKEYKPIWDERAKLTTKKFPDNDHDDCPTIIVHNALRDYWESVKLEQAEQRKRLGNNNNDNNNDNLCPLDIENVTYIPYHDLLFKFNKNPTLEYHLFAKTQDHRPDPLAKDHLTIMNFVEETDYAIYLNLEGSGAGIPDHLHYQGHKRDNFPFLFKYLLSRIKYTGHIDLWRAEMNHYGLMFRHKTQQGKEEVSQILEKLDKVIRADNLSYNLLFDNNLVFIFPRTREIATNIPKELVKAGMDRWQIAGQEMGLLFTAKYKSILKKMTRKALLDAMKDVTISELNKRIEFEKEVIKEIKKRIK